jgi:hypothetical protein
MEGKNVLYSFTQRLILAERKYSKRVLIGIYASPCNVKETLCTKVPEAPLVPQGVKEIHLLQLGTPVGFSPCRIANFGVTDIVVPSTFNPDYLTKALAGLIFSYH